VVGRHAEPSQSAGMPDRVGDRVGMLTLVSGHLRLVGQDGGSSTKRSIYPANLSTALARSFALGTM